MFACFLAGGVRSLFAFFLFLLHLRLRFNLADLRQCLRIQVIDFRSLGRFVDLRHILADDRFDLILLSFCVIVFVIAAAQHLFGIVLAFVEQSCQLFVILCRPLALSVIPRRKPLVVSVLERSHHRLCAASVFIPDIGIQRIIIILCLGNINRGILTVTHFSRNDHETEVFIVIGTGREGNDGIVFIDADRAVDDGAHLQFIDKVQEVIVTAERASQIVEDLSLPFQGIGLEDRDDLPFALFIDGVVGKHRRVAIDFQLIKIGEICKHSAVPHVVTVQDHVLAVQAAAVIEEDRAVFGIVAVEITVEIIRIFAVCHSLGISRRLHHNIVDFCIRHGDPSHGIGVCFDQLCKV